MKVKIENYQAIKKADLEFIPGVNAIVGPTNNGKSSIIRAIKGAINNQGGSSFVNYDAEEAKVTIEYNDHTILWNKSKKQGKSYYEVDGTQLNKIGQTQVKEVADIMNMPEIEVGNERFQINFWKQMDKPFLVDRTAYQLFDFISKSKEQEVVSNLQSSAEIEYKSINKDINESNAKANLTTETITALEVEIGALNKVLEYDVSVLSKVLLLYNNITELTYKLNQLDSSIERFNIQKDRASKIVNQLSSKIDELDNVEEEFTKASSLARKCTNFDNLVQSKATEITKLNNYVTTTESSMSKLDELIKEINSTGIAYKKVNQLVTDLNIISSRETSLTTLLNTYNKDIELSTKDLTDFDVCPLCERPLDKEGEHIHE